MNRIVRSNHIPLIDKIAFGTGNLTYGIIFQMIGTYIVFYATAILKIPGSLVGTAVSISVLWDAISDPLMGYLSDETKSKYFGRRHQYILFGTLAMSTVNFFIWVINPQWSYSVRVATLFISLLLVRTALTVFITPYTALASELSNDYNERTAIQGIRMMFFTLGLMAATVMGFLIFFGPTPEYPVGQLNPDAYVRMGITTSFIALVFGFISFFKSFKYIPYLPQNKSTEISTFNIKKIVASFALALKNRNYRLIVFAYLLSNIATALISTLGIHVFTYTFGYNNVQVGIVFGSIFLSSILSQPAWVKISSKLDKRPTALMGVGISVFASFLFLVFVLNRDEVSASILYMLPFGVIAGFGIGALLSLPFSMVSDAIDLDELQTGKRLEGIYYGSMTFFYKLSQSIAIFIIGIVLDLVKFDSDAPIQPRSTILILGLTIAIGSIIVLILTGFCYYKYELNKSSVEKVQSEIRLKRIKDDS